MKSIFCLAAILPLATSAATQAPQSADLWRVATASLAAPPVSQAGRTGVFRNPAAAGRAPATLRAGVQVLHTPDAVGLTDILGGLDYSIAGTVIAQ